MATIRKRSNSFAVVYTYLDEKGKRKQKWESFKTLSEAKKRKKEVEYKEEVGSLVVPKCKTFSEFLDEYISLYGKEKWALSTYQSNCALIEHYIRPKLGGLKITDITTWVIDRYYQTLKKTKAVSNNPKKPSEHFVTPNTVEDIHKLLRNCFNQAVKWGILEKNPVTKASPPEATSAERDIWTADTLIKALEVCDDPRLALALNVAFSCSLRLGELLGLTWDCVDISEASIRAGTASVRVEKELQRVNRETLKTLEGKDVLMEFPATNPRTTSVLVLKTPKTKSSVRKVFMPKAVAKMLIAWKAGQDDVIEALGGEYQNFNLVFAGSLGLPIEGSTIRGALQRLIKEHDLPPVVFHSFRHASITYKLRLNGGDVKSVQGDSGHSQAKMVTDVYSHIIDDDRKANAMLFQAAFYENGAEEPTKPEQLPNGISAETLTKILANPEMVALLSTLAKTL